MDELEATGALEELLLHQHSLVDRTLYPLLEDAPSQEPSFWQLQVVEYIQNVLKVRVGGCVRDAVDNATAGGQQDPAQVVARVKAQVEIGSELQEALKQLQSDVENEAIRLTQLLTPERGNFGEEGKHFVARFWDKLQSVVAVKEKLLKDDEERDAEGVEEFESCSFEMLTFDDDLNDMSRSAVSFPCMDDFPATIMRMQSIDALERAAGLDELMQMPIVEIIHSGPAFPAACSAVVGLFLDIGICGEKGDTAGRAKRVVYDLMNQVEDAAQFLELYWAILDFMGYHLATGELLLPRQSICENCDAHTIAVLDCFRVFYALVYRVTQHWVYFSAEALAQLLVCTLRLLTIYSNSETEVEAKHANPFMMMSVVDDHPMRWYKLWLLNTPNSRQLFVAIHESGFVADLLQSLSRLRPLALIRSTHPSIESIEKRFIQSTLIVLSYTCEYREGRDLVSRWQRLPAHAYIKRRRTTWERPILEVISADNDSSYHVVEGLASEEEQADDLEAEYERIGAGIVDALVLSIASIIATTPNDEHWSSIISKSVAVYLHVSHIDEIVKGFIQIGNNGFVDSSPRPCISTELEERNPWFPFRQSRGAAEVCQLVIDSVSKRILSGVLTRSMAQFSGQILLYTMLSSEAVLKAEILSLNLETIRSLVGLCKRILQLWHLKVLTSREENPHWSFQSELYELIASITFLPHVFKMANETGVVDELSQYFPTQDADRESFRLYGRASDPLCHSVAGVHHVNNTPLVTPYMDNVHKQWKELSMTKFRELVSCLSFPMFSKAFLKLDGVQTIAPKAIAKLQETIDFSVALNSPYEECPMELNALMCRVQFLLCCLSTQFASSSLLSLEHSPLLQFIADTLATHKLGACMRSCHAEDTCCVAFLMALSLVSSVPAMLECSGLFSELKLLDFDGKRQPQRDVLPDSIKYLGPCSLLEKQLCYEYEFIGGSCEKLSRCELFEFDAYLRQTNSIHENARLNRPKQTNISGFSFTLQKKILRAIKDGVASGLSVPIDFVLISQASWELINDLEAEVTTNSPFMTCKPAGVFNKIFADLIHDLVMSRRSRLEPLGSSNIDDVDANSATTQGGDTFFPSDSERKLMNRLYKNYADGLTLDASPTLLHCIVKKFGKVAMDCFPVTILMMLHPTYDEADILRFLLHCSKSTSAGFLWPKSVLQKYNGVDGNIMALPATAIAAGVEIIIEREFPQILEAIDQCHCSLLSLVVRWHSQNFWNYFDWENIVIYTYFSILYGAEFQVYIIVAILKHLEPTMRELTARHSSRSRAPFLTLIREPIRGFHFSPWRTFLLRLRSEYHQDVEALLFASE